MNTLLDILISILNIIISILVKIRFELRVKRFVYNWSKVKNDKIQ